MSKRMTNFIAIIEVDGSMLAKAVNYVHFFSYKQYASRS